MPRRDSFDEATLLHDWVDRETRPLDVVASWETLVSVYQMLAFTDELTDVQRLGEFKWIIKELNKFLTRQRTLLMSCQNLEAAMQVLQQSFTPSGKTTIDSRQAIAYHKLRQQWITSSLAQIQMMMEGDMSGWNGAGDAGI